MARRLILKEDQLTSGVNPPVGYKSIGYNGLTFSERQSDGDIVSIGESNSNAVTFVDGSSATPSIRFTSDSNTGIFRPAADQLSISCGGTVSVQFDSTGILMPIGTTTQPGLKFLSDSDTGFYKPRTSGGILFNNAIAIACGGLTASMFDTASGANETRLLLFDVTANTLVRVSRGPADSGGTGSRALIIPN